MAFGFDAASEQYFSTSALTHTLAHTNAGNLLLVWVNTVNTSVVGVTYGGDSMTLVGSAANAADVRTVCFKKAEPQTGSNNIVATLAGSVRATMAGLSFVDADAALVTTKGATGTSTAPSVSVTPTASGQLAVDGIGARTGTGDTFTADASQTTRANTIATNNNEASIGCSTELTTGVSAVPMSWTINNSRAWASLALIVRAANTTLQIIPMSGRGYWGVGP